MGCGRHRGGSDADPDAGHLVEVLRLFVDAGAHGIEVADTIGNANLVHLLHCEGVATGVDVEALAEVREPLVAAVGHELTSSLSQIPAVPAAHQA
ncbi:hypothetical protein [Brevibacterium marinum]|uniref:Uncharacterized protein n=1 Tax=Brevibacterium marinum TaxID=418643 RepID=A0A846RTU6_9MICO|nr:hypothetical protein [Brevibacterium marinum]NJC55386.1 hypothetical protein [Brevibacterium marinum]